uniref:Tail protein n=1 Tax=viral metagenome TaxID=1070528 RepID=A0A6M3IXV4_9ZZZZ
MAKIKLYTRNILEDGTVTVTGTADTGYPESRLYDRAISLYWKDTVTEAKTFHVDQGASGNESVGGLFIPKHNFNGEDLTWEYSVNDSDWIAAAVGWTQGDNEQIEKVLAAELTKRYWRVTLTSMANPQCSEIFMSYGYEFQADFVQNPTFEDVPNVQWNMTVGGLERSTMFGNKRRTRTYALFLDTTDLASFRAAMVDLDNYSKPFYLKDHEGSYFMARLVDIPRESFMTEGHVTMTVNFIEML